MHNYLFPISNILSDHIASSPHRVLRSGTVSIPMLKKTKTFLSRKSPKMGTPTMPSPIKGEQLVHFSHPQHSLTEVSMPNLFKCMGCEEYGAGRRFRCQYCNLDLHEFCALAPPSLQRHPLHNQHPLTFHTTKPGGFLRSRCSICGKSIKGYAFRCTTCNFTMHPCCSLFEREMDFPTHPHALILLPVLGNPVPDSSVVCGECQRKQASKIYHCTICNYHLHAVCAKDMVNGLYVHGIRAPPEKPSKLGAVIRFASHAVQGFIGGMIEGIGEELGEDLIDDMRGKVSRIKGK